MDLQSMVQMYGHRFGVYSNAEGNEFTFASIAAYLGDDAFNFAIRFPGEIPVETERITGQEYLLNRVLNTPQIGDVNEACKRVYDVYQKIIGEYKNIALWLEDE